MARWRGGRRRGRRGNRDSAGLILTGEQCRRGKYHGRLRAAAADVGVGAGLNRQRLSRAGSAVTLEVPRPGRRCLWGAFSADIPEDAPGRRWCRRRAAGYGPENGSAVTAAPGAPALPGQATAPVGRRCAVRGTGAARSGAAPFGGAAQPGSAAIRVTGQTPGGRLSPGPRDLPSSLPAFPALALTPWSQSCAARSIIRRRRRAPGAGPFCIPILRKTDADHEWAGSALGS